MNSKMCTPAQIYLIVSVIFLILSYFGMSEISQQLTMNQNGHPILRSLNFTDQKDSRTSYIVQIVVIVLWTWLLSYLCSKGYSNHSWFLVLLPSI